MFQQFKNIDTAFKHIRLFSIALIAACILVSCFAIWIGYYTAERVQGRVYILSNGKLMSAVAAERARYLDVETKDHIRMFHFYFFSLDPDEASIQKSITSALYLADGTAKRQYDNLQEAGFYRELVAGNISQRIETDSISIDLGSSPYYFRYHGKLTITRPTSTTVRSLISEGYLRDDLKPSDRNPHGLLIERWRILENENIKTENR